MYSECLVDIKDSLGQYTECEEVFSLAAICKDELRIGTSLAKEIRASTSQIQEMPSIVAREHPTTARPSATGLHPPVFSSYRKIGIMLISRTLEMGYGRAPFAVVKSEVSAASAASSKVAHNPLEEFFEADRSKEVDTPVFYGRVAELEDELVYTLSVVQASPVNKLLGDVCLLLLLPAEGLPGARTLVALLNVMWIFQVEVGRPLNLRLKSCDDLHKLWYVILKEKNTLMTQCQMLHAQNLRFSNPERVPKVWSHLGCEEVMCRIKHVLAERAIADPDLRRSFEMKRMINAL
ncbi:hypothetical protein EJ110_NYTH39341 [Nymphaea thermarum]|nr:hypothetical protein EJ110_NYTH39341 [Nymphaea thermarum]